MIEKVYDGARMMARICREDQGEGKGVRAFVESRAEQSETTSQDGGRGKLTAQYRSSGRQEPRRYIQKRGRRSALSSRCVAAH